MALNELRRLKRRRDPAVEVAGYVSDGAAVAMLRWRPGDNADATVAASMMFTQRRLCRYSGTPMELRSRWYR